MSEPDWRWIDGGGQEQPIRLEELRVAVARGDIGPGARVQRADSTEWRAAIDVPELYAPSSAQASAPADAAPASGPKGPVMVSPIVPVAPAAVAAPPPAAQAWAGPVASPPQPVPNARATLGFSPSALGALGALAHNAGPAAPKGPVRRISQAMTRTDLTAAVELEAVDLMSDDAPLSTEELSVGDFLVEESEAAKPGIPEETEIDDALDALELPGGLPPSPPANARTSLPAPEPVIAPPGPAPGGPPRAAPVVPVAAPRVGPGPLAPAVLTSAAPSAPTAAPAAPEAPPGSPVAPVAPVDLAAPSAIPQDAAAPEAPAPAGGRALCRVADSSIPVVVDTTGTYRSVVRPRSAKASDKPAPPAEPVPVAPVPVVVLGPTPPPPPVLEAGPRLSVSDEPRPSQEFPSKTTTLIGQSIVEIPESSRGAPAPAAGRAAPVAMEPLVPTAMLGVPSPLTVDPMAATAHADFEPFQLDAPQPPTEAGPSAAPPPVADPFHVPGAQEPAAEAPVQQDDEPIDVLPPPPLGGKLPLVIGGVVVFVGVVVAAALALRPGPAPAPAPAGSTSSAASAPRASASSPPPAPKLGVRCKPGGAPVSIVSKAVVAVGAEVIARDGILGVGYAATETSAQVVRLGAGLAPSPAGTVAVPEALRRVQPVLRKGKLEVSAETDGKSGVLTMRRAVEFDPPFFVGVSPKGIAEARDTGAPKELFSLAGEGPVEALRVTAIGPQKGVALAFRQGAAIYAGVAVGEELSPRGGLEKAAGLGRVGAPSVAVSGDDWLVAFADRADPQAPWSLRLFGGKLGGAGGASAPKTFALPKSGVADGAISPSLIALGGGAFLLAWTGGPESSHQVRAQVVDAAGDPAGEAFDVSQAGVNAGQARGAVDASGQGVLVYYASKAPDYELLAVPIACAKGSE